jgi:hypothetical protein
MNIDEEHKARLLEQVTTFKRDLFEMANFDPNVGKSEFAFSF